MDRKLVSKLTDHLRGVSTEMDEIVFQVQDDADTQKDEKLKVLASEAKEYWRELARVVRQ